MKRYKKTTPPGMMLLAVAFLVFGLAASAMAVHPPIQLLNADGDAIDSTTAVTAKMTAYSSKETCGACHNGTIFPGFDTNKDGTLDSAIDVYLDSYATIEKHSYHSQLGANQMAEYGGMDPAKPWVQSPGHLGKW